MTPTRWVNLSGMAVLSGLVVSGWALADSSAMPSPAEAASQSRQTLGIGSARAAGMGNMHSTVKIGNIRQQGTQGVRQSVDVGTLRDGEARSFKADVATGKVEQLGHGGEKQAVGVGSIIRATVSDAASTRVVVEGVRQSSSDGEVVLGMARDASVRKLESTLSVPGKVETGRRPAGNDNENAMGVKPANEGQGNE